MLIATPVRLAAGSALALVLLMGCTRTGDFDRAAPLPPLYKPPASGAVYATGTVSKIGYPLTDEEKELRALANGIFTAGAPIEPSLFLGVRRPARPLAVSPPAQGDAYVAYIVEGPFRSATARYSRLIDDTRSDIARLEAFLPVARRVADLDAKRRKSLPHVGGLTEGEIIAAQRRIRENMMLMAEVHRTLSERAATYRVTLGRLVVAVPSPMAVDADRARGELERRLATVQIVGSSSPPSIFGSEA